MKIRMAILLLPLLMVGATATAADFVVIAHPSVKATTLTKEELREIFLRKKLNWGDGSMINPVDQPPDSPPRSSFSKTVHGKSSAAIVSYWRQQVFSGRQVPPVEMRDEAQVIAFVRSKPGAIGYVAASSSTSGVIVVSLK